MSEPLTELLERASAVMMKHAQYRPKLNMTITFGHVAQVPRQVRALREMVLQRRPRVICEMGFNAGHSAIVFLENTSAQLNSFDLFNLPYSAPTRGFVAARYPGRVKFHEGNTKATVPRYNQAVEEGRAAPCDIWLVDADHYKNVWLDFKHVLGASSRNGTLIVADDTTERFPFVLRYWRRLVLSRNVSQLSCETVELGTMKTRRGWENNTKGWCVGEVVRRAGGRRAHGGAATHRR